MAVNGGWPPGPGIAPAAANGQGGAFSNYNSSCELDSDCLRIRAYRIWGGWRCDDPSTGVLRLGITHDCHQCDGDDCTESVGPRGMYLPLAMR
jgi:hypothetical protein